MIHNEKSVNLSVSEYLKLTKKMVGQGTDGATYKFNNDTLLKVYHEKKKELELYINLKEMINDDSITKQYCPKQKIPPQRNNAINFIDNHAGEEIKIRSQEAISSAIDRQKYVKRTNLPLKAAYVDNYFIGCLVKQSHGIQLHYLMGLPLNYRLAIMKEIMLSFKELLDNCIYHIDLNNSPFSKRLLINNNKTIYVGHSHVLVNPFTKATNIIDLEGTSTVYTTIESEYKSELAMYSLTQLILEFILHLDMDEFCEDEDRYEALAGLNISSKYIDDAASLSFTFEQANEFLDYVRVYKKSL